MNLLDQLFQYSLKTDNHSLSLSAIENSHTLAFSSLSLSSSSIYDSQIFTSSQIGSQNNSEKWVSAFEGTLQTHEQKDSFYDYKDKYRKLSNLSGILSNKIRKSYLEFHVKLENYTKQLIQSIPLKIEVSKFQESKPSLAVYRFQQVNSFHIIVNKLLKHKYLEQKRQSFSRIISKNSRRFRAQYFFQRLQSLILNSQLHLKLYSITRLKEKKLQAKTIPKINQLEPIKIALFSRKIQISKQQPIIKSQDTKQLKSQKLNNLHPQKHEVQNQDLFDITNIFLPVDHFNQNHLCHYATNVVNRSPIIEQGYRSTTNHQLSQSQVSIQARNKFQRRRKSDVTNITRSASHVDCESKTFTEIQQQLQNQKYKQKLPYFGISQWSDRQNPVIIDEQSCQFPQNIDINDDIINHYLGQLKQQNEGYHKSDIQRYVNFKKSIDKRRNSTLKQIQRSKQAIKKIVSQLKDEKSRPKNQLKKQKIKLINTKTDCKHKYSSKQASAANSKANSPARLKSASSRKQRSSSHRKDDKSESNEVQGQILRKYSKVETAQEYHEIMTNSKNLQVYYQYINAKKCRNEPSQSAHKKKSYISHQQRYISKQGISTKNSTATKNLLLLSKDQAAKQKRIDLKVEFKKSQITGSSAIQKEKSKQNSKKVK